MTTTQHLTAGLITVNGTLRMAFRRDGQVFYFPHIRAQAKLATPEQAATWED